MTKNNGGFVKTHINFFLVEKEKKVNAKKVVSYRQTFDDKKVEDKNTPAPSCGDLFFPEMGDSKDPWD